VPLLDHFHPPLAPTHSWQSFHARWATAIANALDRTLPERYFAEVLANTGARVEADVSEYDTHSKEQGNGASGGVSVATWTPPRPAQTVGIVFPDDIEIQVLDQRGDAKLVAVIELISPSNKDRQEHCRAFAIKCAAHLQRGVGLMMVDVVTARRADLHLELLALLGQTSSGAPPTELYAVSYRPVYRDENAELDIWSAPLEVGRPLPEMPLALRGDGCYLVNLEATYTEARQWSRL
jgi:hypothetical protein